MEKIKVNNSGIVHLKSIEDKPDGSLHIYESGKNDSIEVKRFYIINGLSNKKAIRGNHAHKKLSQYIFCVHGSFTLGLDDGSTKQKVVLDKPEIGVILGPKLWHTMEKFSDDCVILVIADDYYNESDYIRKYDDFLNYIKNEA